MDEAAQAKFLKIVNDDLSPKDRAQALIDLQNEFYASGAAKRTADFNSMVDQWGETLKKDPVLGGANFAGNQSTVNQLVTQFGTPGLNAALKWSGLSNHPDFFRFLLKLAPALLEGSNPGGGTPAVPEETVESRMYPTMRKQG
jgi:hypothetical protein